MNVPRINHEIAIGHLEAMLAATAGSHVLRLLGAGKMGKTFLMSHVFPAMLNTRGIRYALVDLRNPAQGPLDFLDVACSQLGRSRFANFDDAHEEWINRPRVEVRGLQALLSSIKVSSRSDADEAERVAPLLTRKFVADLQQMDDGLVMLLFDAVDNAASAVQSWLMDSLLVQLNGLAHLRVVVAGRTLPDAAGAYAARCHSHELQRVTDEEAYIAYCQAIGVQLVEQSIRDFARAVDYAPGQFAELVKGFAATGDGDD